VLKKHILLLSMLRTVVKLFVETLDSVAEREGCQGVHWHIHRGTVIDCVLMPWKTQCADRQEAAD